MRMSSANLPWEMAAVPACARAGGVSVMRAQLATIGHTWTLAPNLVVDGILGFSRWAMDLVAPDYGKNWGLDYLGIPGTNGPDIRQSGFPIFSFNTYTTMGSPDAWNPAFYRNQTYTHTTNISLIIGHRRSVVVRAACLHSPAGSRP